MLTASQCEIVAYMGEGFIVCPECAREEVGLDEEGECFELAKADMGLDNDSGFTPIIEYVASSEFPEGLWCEYCSVEIAEPVMVEATWTIKTVVPSGQEDDLDWDLRRQLQGQGFNVEGPEVDYA